MQTLHKLANLDKTTKFLKDLAHELELKRCMHGGRGITYSDACLSSAVNRIKETIDLLQTVKHWEHIEFMNTPQDEEIDDAAMPTF